jgi:hypothetical protein
MLVPVVRPASFSKGSGLIKHHKKPTQGLKWSLCPPPHVCVDVQVDPSKIIWTPYDASHEYATFKS